MFINFYPGDSNTMDATNDTISKQLLIDRIIAKDPSIYEHRHIAHASPTAIIVICLITYTAATLCLFRRLYVRCFRLHVLLVDDYLTIFTWVVYTPFTILLLYGAGNLMWGSEVDDFPVARIEMSMKILFSLFFLSNFLLNIIRIAIMLCFRVIFNSTDSHRNRKLCFYVSVIINTLYLIVSLVWRVFLFGADQFTANIDIWAYLRVKQRVLPLQLVDACMNFFLNACVPLMTAFIIHSISKASRVRSSRTNITQTETLLEYSFRPCVPSVIIGTLGLIPSAFRIYYASRTTFNNLLMELVCIQIQGLIYILIACGPMIRAMFNKVFGFAMCHGVQMNSRGVLRSLSGTGKTASRRSSDGHNIHNNMNNNNNMTTTSPVPNTTRDFMTIREKRVTPLPTDDGLFNYRVAA